MAGGRVVIGRTASVLMVQGTASNVGKSVLTAGLGRILRRRGFRVAPFKAQNMSLNAAVTPDGGEIARSTAVQAAAAGVEPKVDMNPILVKPAAGMRSQVIVRGKVWRTLGAGADRASLLDLWPVVAAALDRLRADYDVVLAEGAGSPAEMNLRDRDLANMRVARHADAAVILVGDIDRGGVFAQLLGTLDLLPPDERDLIRGLVVNRFYGDPALFTEGVRFLERRAGRPVFGVVPFVRDLGLPEEDAATLDDPRRFAREGDRRSRAEVSIAVVRLPHLANFDDLGPLERLPGVSLTFATRPGELSDADLVILPGSKSTVADLHVLRERGLDDALRAARARGTPIMGICGGFQMLGEEIRDPAHVESSDGRVPGLGLLPHATVFDPEKRTARVRARLVARFGPLASAAGAEIDGYEIHHGRICPRDAGETVAPFRVCARSGVGVDEPDGAISADGLVFGTYLHGLFENAVVRQALLAWLADRARGRSPGGGGPDPPRETDSGVDPFDRWADVLETTLDVPSLLARCGIAAPPGAPG